MTRIVSIDDIDPAGTEANVQRLFVLAIYHGPDGMNDIDNPRTQMLVVLERVV